jgi:hypothetical protein
MCMKQDYDGEMFFYVPKGVGSDSWTVGLGTGRMCKTSGWDD